MKIIISPAKKMRRELDFLPPRQNPVFLEQAYRLKEWMKALPYEELKQLLQCSDAIAQSAYQLYQTMDLQRDLTPALLSYEGIQYQYMAPQVFESQYFEYVEQHLRILSGLYGILRPFDGVVPYRLEMKTKLEVDGKNSLSTFWGRKIYQELTKGETTILNLASKEYSKVVEPYLTPDIRYVTCVFGEMKETRVIEKGVYVKMARGEMVRFMAENQITRLEEVKAFRGLGYSYQKERSDEKTYVFLK